MPRPTPSPLAVLLCACGVIASVATTCGPPEEETGYYYYYDTGSTGGTTDTEPPEGVTLAWDGSFALGHVGATQSFTVTTTLPMGCLAEVDDYAWGYPTGDLVISYSFRPGTADTGGDSGVDTSADTSADTGPDTGTPPPGPEPDTSDTGVSGETGVEFDSSDTSGSTDTSDTGDTSDSGDTSTAPSDTADTSDTSDTSDTGDSGATGLPEGIRVTIARSDAGAGYDDYLPLASGSGNGTFADDSPWTSCAADAECNVTWTVVFELVEPQPVNGTMHVRPRLHMCSSGVPDTGDIYLSVE